ncbi:hypothetical protein [Pseudoalteromonas sp. MMG007]|uniref:hypothetical protein n=1 Tax=Pseudoalteromonas sp. MMG007 TaxID=2822684 RepID=UPI001B38C487|nr:hypothetical protein [Pseudoalteromonas sp. MMG007]MBQ4857818.1 hypothetical protein [Pseudoalteromonas sp. MMG007]
MIKNEIKGPLILVVISSLLACNSIPIKNTTKNDIYIKQNAQWLAGSWGVTQRVDGGYKLDKTANSSNWVAGAEQIVKNLPSVGHVITSFTHPAHAYLFTLRDNNNVDVAAIHPDMVPSIENEKIILDVINVYRRAGKKVILYLNAAGPSMILSSDPNNEIAIKKAWKNYYNSKWDGDEGAAWRDLVLGYAQRFDGLVDGYWLDNANKLPGEVSDFVAMLRSVDPTLAITVNKTKTYFKNNNDDFIYVDSDGVNDTDKRNYKIIKYAATNEFEDFTSGHITPLGRGAPPNSWAYEEYTIPDMVSAPWDHFEGKNNVLKHAWFPIRSRWSVAKTDLVFGVEQAYRFTRKITDAGAGITWSTTQKNGYMGTDEMQIMRKIQRRIENDEEYMPYERPNGAYLLKQK